MSLEPLRGAGDSEDWKGPLFLSKIGGLLFEFSREDENQVRLHLNFLKTLGKPNEVVIASLAVQVPLLQKVVPSQI